MKNIRISIFLWILFCMVIAPEVNALTTNFRAQGHYYSAKEALQNKQYNKALDYVYKCKETLNGTNQELQYLHVLSAYNAGNAKEAQTEILTFFELEEGKLKSVEFDKSVDKLTDDEVRALTMLINKIEDAVGAQITRAKRRQKYNEMMTHINYINSVIRKNSEIGYKVDWSYSENCPEARSSQEIEYIYGSEAILFSEDTMTATFKGHVRFKNRDIDQCKKWISDSFASDIMYRMIDFGRLKGVEWKEEVINSYGSRVLVDKTAGLRWIILTFEPDSLEVEQSNEWNKTNTLGIMLASSRVESMDSLIAAFHKLKELAQ